MADTSYYYKKVKQQTDEMAGFTLNDDVKSFVKNTYPTVVEKLGGEEKMIETMKDLIKNLKSDGTIVTNVKAGNPTKIIADNNLLQCVLPVKTELKNKKRTIIFESTLVAISKDGGEHWLFIDTSGKEIDKIKEVIPEVSKDLVFPPINEPQVIEE